MTGYEKDMDEMAVNLAHLRLLACSLKYSDSQPTRTLALRIQKFDDAGVFRAIDEYTGYASPEDILEGKKITTTAP